MFNEKRKSKFIEDKRSKYNVNMLYLTVRIFEVFQKYEEQWQADLCTKGYDDLKFGIKEINKEIPGAKWSSPIVLRDYLNWCKENGVKNISSDEKLFNPKIDKARKYLVKNPEHLQNYLDAMFDKESENTIDVSYRCFVWLIYSGLNADEAVKITSDNIDYTNKRILYNKEEYPLYDESLMAFQNSITCFKFKYKHPLYTTFRNRYPGDALVRGYNEFSLDNLVSIIAKRNTSLNTSKVLDLDLNVMRIQKSGLYYRMYEQEQKSGMEVDYYEYSSRAAGEKLPRKKKTAAGSREYKRAYDLKEEYEYWKAAYGL